MRCLMPLFDSWIERLQPLRDRLADCAALWEEHSSQDDINPANIMHYRALGD